MAPFTEILKTIQLVRESFVGSEVVYTQGSCVRLALLLEHLYPGGEVLYNWEHAIYCYNEICYDIGGFAETSESYLPLRQLPMNRVSDILKLTYKI